MTKENSKLRDEIDWRLVKAWRKKGETWKEISVRTGIRHYLLRDWAVKLKKTDLLGGRRGSRLTADWSLIAKLYREGKPLDEIAAEAGFASSSSLSTVIGNRRKDGRWNLPKRAPRRLHFQLTKLAHLS